jgi:pimeloyl-ACP methyl ester carboxylesterase
MAAGARSMSDPRKWPMWNAVRCPTLVLRGERSPALSQQAAERMVAGKENAVLEVIPGASHFIPIEAPALFEAAVRRWLRL